MPRYQPGTDEWLAQVREDIIEPERPIIDPHHHIWKKRFNRNYLLADLWKDTGSGHKVEKTVFVECSAFYYRDGPQHLRPAGEVEFVAACARQSRNDPSQATIAGIVAHADLTLAGDSPARFGDTLDLLTARSGGLLRGIRHCAAHDATGQELLIPGWMPAGLYQRESFRQGLRELAARGLTFDAWHYHHQNRDFLEVARAVPECPMILDHFGTPLGAGAYRNRRDEIFRQWREDMAAIARCGNVHAKLGGLAMPDNGFGWHLAERPPDSDELVAAQEKYYRHAIDCFGPRRCMFESNFPVDRLSISYPVLWNAFKKLAMNFSGAEKERLFRGTAAEVYSL